MVRKLTKMLKNGNLIFIDFLYGFDKKISHEKRMFTFIGFHFFNKRMFTLYVEWRKLGWRRVYAK